MTQRISVSSPFLSPNALKYVTECIQSTWISSTGKFIGEFEQAFAEFCGVKHAVACNNGTTALHLALAALGIGPGDEVIVPDLTYIASANCVSYCGAKPIFVDSNPDTFNIDPHSVAAAITPRTRAIMPVHLYGQSCEMDPIREIAHEHGLLVVEDAAEAHGAFYKGKRVGGLGDCAAFSFFGNKIITTGEGGMVTTDDDALADQLRLLRAQGMDPNRRYWFPVVGYNYRMTNLAAAIGVSQMECIEDLLANRQQLKSWYDEDLVGMPHLQLPYSAPNCGHVNWMYTVRVLDSAPVSRDRFMADLDVHGIENRPAFYPMHLLPPYEQPGDLFPNATLVGRQGVNLPTHAHLTRENVRYICDTIRQILAP